MEESIREKLKHWLEHGMIFLKWVACALLMGLVLGAAGTLFHYCVDGANRYSGQYPYLIWFLPLGGLLIVFLYKITKMERDQGTDLVIRSVRSTEPISIKTAPLILSARSSPTCWAAPPGGRAPLFSWEAAWRLRLDDGSGSTRKMNGSWLCAA